MAVVLLITGLAMWLHISKKINVEHTPHDTKNANVSLKANPTDFGTVLVKKPAAIKSHASYKVLALGSTNGFSQVLSKTVGIETLRAVLDRSMKEVSSVYIGHQVISSAASSNGVISFVYGLETAGLKSLDQLAQETSKALAKQEAGLNMMNEARREGDREKMLVAARLQVDGDRELVREDVYTTVELSSTKMAPPVLMFQKGLPDWLIQSPKAESMSSARLSGALTLQDITRQVVGGSLIFTYRDSAGSQVYVDPMNGGIYSQRELVQNTRRKNDSSDNSKVNPERDARIARQWDEFLTSGIDFSQFTLNDLEDLSKRR